MSDNPQFIQCAMEAIEQGIRAQAIKEECACRMGLKSQGREHTKSNNFKSKE